jgi:hypothetical protein
MPFPDHYPDANRALLRQARECIAAVEFFDFSAPYKTVGWAVWSEKVGLFNSIGPLCMRVSTRLWAIMRIQAEHPVLSRANHYTGWPFKFVREQGPGAWAAMRAEIDALEKLIPEGNEWPKELP